MICYRSLASNLFQTADFAHRYWQVRNKGPSALWKWHGGNPSPLIGLRHTKGLILNFSLIRTSTLRGRESQGVFFRILFMQMKLFFPAHRFFQFFQQVISPNWRTTAWTAARSSSCWLVGVDLFFIYICIYIYIYTHIWVWLGWYFVWSSWKWAMRKAHITGFFFFFFKSGLMDTLTWRAHFILLRGKCTFLLATPNPGTWFAGFGETPFLALLCYLAITIPLSKKVNKRQKRKKKKTNRNPQQLALACLPYETPWSCEAGAMLSTPVIFIISKDIKNHILFRW